MTYVVVESCIKCKFMDCVEVCPVDCFYEGENMLVIHPDECIDCGVCEPECPVEAIKPAGAIYFMLDEKDVQRMEPLQRVSPPPRRVVPYSIPFTSIRPACGLLPSAQFP